MFFVHTKYKASAFIFSGFKGVFEKLHFHVGLVCTVDLNLNQYKNCSVLLVGQ